MINSLHIKNIATYNSIGVEINALNKVNFIFGGNGCGKTTISNFLFHHTQPNESDSNYSSCEVAFKDQEKVKILTYNKKFRDLNFYKDSEIPGVFTLGEASIEQKQAINRKTEQLNLANKDLANVQIQIKKFQNLSDEHVKESIEKCWKVFKQYEDDFKPALLGTGSIGSKVSFRNKILNTLPFIQKIIKPHSSLVDRTKTLFSTTLEPLPEIILNTTNPLKSYESSEIWKTIIIGKKDLDIAKLINKLNITDWVNQGRAYIHDSTCPFCQNETIDDVFKSRLEEYFDNEFESKVKNLKSIQEQYELACINLIKLLENILSNEIDRSSKLNTKVFAIELESLKNLLKLNIQLSREKLSSISSVIELKSSSEIYKEILSLIKNANTEIQNHNNLVLSHVNETAILRSEIWDFLTFEAYNRISSHETTINNHTKTLKGMRNSEEKGLEKTIKLRNELSELTSTSTGVQAAVDEINKSLIGFGFTNFMIDNAEESNNYWIKRNNGDNALHSLSEGESTFITFLYYLQLIKGFSNKEEVITNKILVIDDPISSLDSNVLFMVSTLIKGLIKDTLSSKSEHGIKQIVILTHNVYFHKEISFQLQKDDSNHVNYWILRKRENTTSITNHGPRNPISSSYQMLWNDIKESDKSSSTSIQNIIRRILENYFKILGNYNDAKIIDAFDTFEEKKICQSLLHWINDGSHCIPDDLFIQPLDSEKDKYLDVFRKIFKNSGHEAHYNMMMGITNHS